MDWPDHQYDGLEVPPSSDPFDVYLDNGGSEIEDDVNDCEEDDYTDRDEY